MKKKLVAVLLCVAMLFSFAAMTASASETTTAAAETETDMVAPANFVQFIMAIFVRLFELVAGLFS